jgi:hypothetical protein
MSITPSTTDTKNKPMRLHELIALLDEEGLQDLAARCIPGSPSTSVGLLRMEVEEKIRQRDYIESVVFARRPPAFAVFVELLAAEGFRCTLHELSERVNARVKRWREGVTSGDLLAKDDKRELYRKLLRAAWSNDLQLDASEASLLGLLRRELGLSRSEHFLLAFDDSIAHLWDGTHEAQDLVRVLRNHGLVWSIGDDIALAEEMEESLRRATGVELDAPAYQRLLDRVSMPVLREVLDNAGLRKSGSKAELAERVIANLISPSTVLDSNGGRAELVSLARTLDLSPGGRKEELIQRIIACFRTDIDLTAGKGEGESPPLPVEPKALTEPNFLSLFRPLSNLELHALLTRLDLPLSGTKDVRIGQLWASRFCETTLLVALKGDVLDRICDEHGVSRAGKKSDQIERLLQHLRSRETAEPAASEPAE